jgi:hypothetical protein
MRRCRDWRTPAYSVVMVVTVLCVAAAQDRGAGHQGAARVTEEPGANGGTECVCVSVSQILFSNFQFTTSLYPDEAGT